VFHISGNLRWCRSVTNTLIFLSVLRQVNTVNDHTSYAFNIHRNIILPSTPMFSKCSLSFRFSPPKPYTHFFSPLYTCRISCSSHSASFYRPNKMLSYSLSSFPQSPAVFSLSDPDICPITLFSNTLSFSPSFHIRDQFSHKCTAGTNVLCTVCCVFFWEIPRRLNFICRHFGTLSVPSS